MIRSLTTTVLAALGLALGAVSLGVAANGGPAGTGAFSPIAVAHADDHHDGDHHDHGARRCRHADDQHRVQGRQPARGLPAPAKAALHRCAAAGSAGAVARRRGRQTGGRPGRWCHRPVGKTHTARWQARAPGRAAPWTRRRSSWSRFASGLHSLAGPCAGAFGGCSRRCDRGLHSPLACRPERRRELGSCEFRCGEGSGTTSRVRCK